MATYLFIGFWVLLALVIVLAAMRGGRRGGVMFNAQSRTGRRMLAVLTALMLLIFGIGLPVISGIEASGTAGSGPAGVELTAAERNGRELFSQSCSQCHSLAAASAIAQVGPDLDELRPPEALVLDAIEQGRARGQGQMPAQLVEGQNARDVAAFVAKVAGRGRE